MKIVLLLLMLCCASSWAQSTPSLSDVQKRRMMLLTTTFENAFAKGSQPFFLYGYIDNLKDGRGYTAGRVGFCSATGDLLKVVEDYSRLKPKNALEKYLPELRRLASEASDDVAILDGLIYDWKAAAEHPEMKAAQDAIAEKLYYLPAVALAESAGVKLPFGIAIIYDTVVMHGTGEDPDSASAIAQRATTKISTQKKKNEKLWLQAFLTERLKVLKKPNNAATHSEWSQNTKRAEILLTMLNSGKFDSLDKPLVLKNYYFEGNIP